MFITQETSVVVAKKSQKIVPPSKRLRGRSPTKGGWRGTISFEGEEGARSALFSRRVSAGEAVRFENGMFASVVRANHSLRGIVLRMIPTEKTSMTREVVSSFPIFSVPVFDID